MRKQIIKDWWVCRGKKKLPYFNTMSRTRKGSIQKLMGYQGIGWNTDASNDWEYYRSCGWDCYKISLTMTLNPSKR